VAAFLNGTLGFDEIPQVIEDVLSETKADKLESIQEVLEADEEARRVTRRRLEQRGKPAMVSAGPSSARSSRNL
jgi:1-deoxy-D-xylulose 5-phosphate reductoisomerase